MTQEKSVSEIRAEFWEIGPFCCNCELERAWVLDHPDIPEFFCSPACREDFHSQVVLENFLSKRRRRLARQGGRP
jgi:hypothetical protein